MEELYRENAPTQILVLARLKTPLIIATGLGMLAVLLGAFGAHGLEGAVESNRLRPELLESWHTAVEYQYYHVFALLFCCLFSGLVPGSEKSIRRSLWLFAAGIFLFSGSLYLMTAADLMGAEWKFLGPITPLGGLLLAAGWGNLLFFLLIKFRKA